MRVSLDSRRNLAHVQEIGLLRRMLPVFQSARATPSATTKDWLSVNENATSKTVFKSPVAMNSPEPFGGTPQD